MKKKDRQAIYFFTFLILVILALIIFSPNFFHPPVGKYTKDGLEINVLTHPEEAQNLVGEAYRGRPLCKDSEYGLNYDVGGYVTGYRDLRAYKQYDSCSSGLLGGYVKEYYCKEERSAVKYSKCSRGCENGACVTGCTDSDNGLNLNVQGTCTDSQTSQCPGGTCPDGTCPGSDGTCPGGTCPTCPGGGGGTCPGGGSPSQGGTSGGGGTCPGGTCPTCPGSRGDYGVTDYCQSNQLYETYCHPSLMQCFTAPGYVCPEGYMCSIGACVVESIPPEQQPPSPTPTPPPPPSEGEGEPTPPPPTPTGGYTGLIKITVDNYADLREQLSGLGPFLVYGWVTSVGNFDSQLAKLESTLGNPDVGKRGVLFSVIDDIEAKINDVPDWIDIIIYTTEPSYTPEYNDIFLENEDNSVVRAVKMAHAHGFELHWGPLPGSFDWHSGIAASDAVLNLLAQEGWDGAYMQYQGRIGSDCPYELVYGPLARADTVQEAIAHLRQFIPDIQVGIQVTPSGCNSGDALNCGVQDYCREFLVLAEQAGMTYGGIWVPDTATIREIRG